LQEVKEMEMIYKADDFTIREATISDAKALQRLYHDYLGKHIQYDLEDIKDSIESNDVYVAVLEKDHIVGTLTSEKGYNQRDSEMEMEDGFALVIEIPPSITIGDVEVTFDCDTEYLLRDLCVDENFRGKGIASALLERASNPEDYSAYAVVWAPGGEIRAKELWESHGFELDAVAKDVGTIYPEFCKLCSEYINGCRYCESYIYRKSKTAAAYDGKEAI